ncbi:hypothetical protein RhiirA5_417223 [Rhizophagus irregularis]|uniref:Uncharacterized protein n=1 Tax=Rhizophagus irregularis TaxID=588596 RepID=A0A2N0PMY0_9GLOM|nr:hypothetical protein RhiirA5_417223 [Rhizophagus irregularis]CAB5199801.1 unnamed protein product [Rhizophagus irregularis]CAB5199803.1 unnamed protein product [Rhizophagus irregularis]
MDLLIFQQDVQEKYPEEVGLLTPPYEEEASVERKILITYNCLQHSIKLKSRILALENAYFVGKLLAEKESYSKRFLLKKNIANKIFERPRYKKNEVHRSLVPVGLFNRIFRRSSKLSGGELLEMKIR